MVIQSRLQASGDRRRTSDFRPRTSDLSLDLMDFHTPIHVTDALRLRTVPHAGFAAVQDDISFAIPQSDACRLPPELSCCGELRWLTAPTAAQSWPRTCASAPIVASRSRNRSPRRTLPMLRRSIIKQRLPRHFRCHGHRHHHRNGHLPELLPRPTTLSAKDASFLGASSRDATASSPCLAKAEWAKCTVLMI